MKKAEKVRTLYKYRPLNARTWSMLLGEGVYFANPDEFNDPLECAPIVKVDSPVNILQNIYWFLRVQALRMTVNDFKGHAKRYGWAPMEVTTAELSKTISLELEELYHSRYDPEYGEEQSWEECLRLEIEKLLRRSYVKGVFSMAESELCPLMWSHYGDEHRGVCIGYDIPANMKEPPHRVSYTGDRLVSTDDIWRSIGGNKVCQARVDKACLYRKAPQWKYEKEWRFPGAIGIRADFLKIRQIVFGLRCTSRSKYAVVKALSGHCDPIRYNEIAPDPLGFGLNKCKVDTERLIDRYDGHGQTAEEIWRGVFS